MLIDVFKADGFTMSSLTALINEQPHIPGRIGELGIFEEQGIATTTLQVEKVANSLALVANTPRGGHGQQVKADKRSVIPFIVPHLPESATIMADEIQNLRAFGSESDEQSMSAYVAQRLATMRRNLDATTEYHRIGAIKGQVLDADGSTVITDMFTAFGLAQQSMALVLGTATTKVRNKLVAAKRLAENDLGAANIMSWRCFMGDTLFDDFVSHADVKDAYARWEDGAALRNDVRGGFEFAGIRFENYRGAVGATKFVADTEGYLIPEGVPGLFITRFAPADTMEFVNTLGLPMYAQQEVLRMGKGVELESQTNPASLCTRPRAVIKITG